MVGITKNIFKQAQTVFPSEKSVHGYFLRNDEITKYPF